MARFVPVPGSCRTAGVPGHAGTVHVLVRPAVATAMAQTTRRLPPVTSRWDRGTSSRPSLVTVRAGRQSVASAAERCGQRGQRLPERGVEAQLRQVVGAGNALVNDCHGYLEAGGVPREPVAGHHRE